MKVSTIYEVEIDGFRTLGYDQTSGTLYQVTAAGKKFFAATPGAAKLALGYEKKDLLEAVDSISDLMAIVEKDLI